MLREQNVRSGFFDDQHFTALVRHLPEAIQSVVEFAYQTGWRIPSEVLPLQWHQVDFTGKVIRLDPGTTKNGEGRQFPMTANLAALLRRRREDTDRLQRERNRVIPWVFHRQGKQIRDFRGAWKTACEAAGCPSRIPHDFRRTAVRNLVRAGVPERVAMQLTGHKTRSVFERYNIVSHGDLVSAGARLDAADSRTGTRTGTEALFGHFSKTTDLP